MSDDGLLPTTREIHKNKYQVKLAHQSGWLDVISMNWKYQTLKYYIGTVCSCELRLIKEIRIRPEINIKPEGIL
jgi:hypothetical protein